jgi:hypothetical protein
VTWLARSFVHGHRDLRAGSLVCALGNRSCDRRWKRGRRERWLCCEFARSSLRARAIDDRCWRSGGTFRCDARASVQSNAKGEGDQARQRDQHAKLARILKARLAQQTTHLD